MRFCNRFLFCSIIVGSTATTGCTTGGGSGGYQSFMEKCEAAATTEEKRTECAWENASRMAGGGS